MRIPNWKVKGENPVPSGMTFLNPAIRIFKSDDVVFSDVTAGLHLDDNDIVHPAITKAMFMPSGDECGLVFMDRVILGAVYDLGRALKHDPMLTAMTVHL